MEFEKQNICRTAECLGWIGFGFHHVNGLSCRDWPLRHYFSERGFENY